MRKIKQMQDDIFNWLTRESPKSKALQLLDAPFADSIESQATIDTGFVEEPDMIRQALREIEGIASQLKKKSPNEAIRLKALTDKLFACRDYQLDNETDVAGEIRRAIAAYYEPKVNASTLTLEMAKAQYDKRPATGRAPTRSQQQISSPLALWLPRQQKRPSCSYDKRPTN